MKSKKLLTLLASITLATSGVGITSAIAPQSVQAESNVEYYLLDHSTAAYDSNGNIEPSTTVNAGFKFYANLSTIKTINGRQFIGLSTTNHEIYVPFSEVKPVYIPSTSNNQSNINISGSSSTSDTDNNQIPVDIPTTAAFKPKTEKHKAKKKRVGYVGHYATPTELRGNWYRYEGNNKWQHIKITKHSYKLNGKTLCSSNKSGTKRLYVTKYKMNGKNIYDFNKFNAEYQRVGSNWLSKRKIHGRRVMQYYFHMGYFIVYTRNKIKHDYSYQIMGDYNKVKKYLGK